ncbi:MAG: LuxR family transcriptional regulator [Merismopedia sp. SIO2A8]|nr:LuxR family transcriptional regulator [Merismopedia sp. SIO2A8]
MTISLKLLFAAIHQCQHEDDLRSRLAPQVGEYFTAKRSGIFFFDQVLSEPKFQSILNIALSLEHNPLARYLTESHTPVHEGLVTTPKAWKLICPRADHWHVMAGPIVNNGQLVGAVGCTREKSMLAFDRQDLADLSAVCLHLSTWTTTVKLQHSMMQSQPSSLSTKRLTPRELEIANLVALGYTNAEIGKELWITENSVKQALKRMFRKLNVSSRTKMVTQLFATQPDLARDEQPSLKSNAPA